ncbi:glucose 1-dehydrogenase [Bordetella petrii]|nr:glucose 1-dehydrogenase [Bordetella petrii]
MRHAVDLSGQVALVTGASSGIGKGIALELAAAGARVVVNHRPTGDSARRAAEVVDAITGAGGTAVAGPADISRESDVEQLFRTVADHFQGIDILVNNAGIEQPAPIQDMTLAQWQQVIDVNLTGQFLCSRAAVRAFLGRQPGPPADAAAGKIIFISSVHEVIPWAFQANYAASKGGVSLLMQSLAQELAPMKIRVNSVAPGAIRTPINAPAWNTPDSLAALLKLIPYGRIGEPDDVARAVAWLASDASDYVTGSTLFVDGGMTLYPAFRGAG